LGADRRDEPFFFFSVRLVAARLVVFSLGMVVEEGGSVCFD
jgi:hypothetical protein